MSEIDILKEAVKKQTLRSGGLSQQESAILSANMRYFGNVSVAQAKKNDCEVAIRGALNRYFKVGTPD